MSSDVAIFFDLDNLLIGASEASLPFDLPLILQSVGTLTGGRIALRRAYGDWRNNQRIPEQLTAAGFELQGSVRLGQHSKNLADMQMVVDAMETLIDGHNFGTYVLITGDRDFLPLVQTLRKRGKVVIGLGTRHTASRSLVSLCDHYLIYNELVADSVAASADRWSDALRQALDALLAERDRVPASVLKQHLLQSAPLLFANEHGSPRFSDRLAQHADVLRTHQEGSTLFVRRPGTPPPLESETSERPRRLSPEDEQALLQAALDEILPGNGRVRASVLKQKMQGLSRGAFDEQLQGDRSFRGFLNRYQPLVELVKGGTTLYIERADGAAKTPLPANYRTALKKHGLRIVPADVRLPLLNALLVRLDTGPAIQWRDLVQWLSEPDNTQMTTPVSKNIAGDILRLARQAGVIVVDSDHRSLAKAQVTLAIDGDRRFQEMVMQCDAAYLRRLAHLEAPLDLEAAAIALYNGAGHSRYLKIVHGRYNANGPV